MGRNFDDYPGFHPFRPWANTYAQHCKPIPCNENRVSPLKFSHREIPVMKRGVSAMRTGVPSNEKRFFPVWKTSQGKPCSGPVLALYGIAVRTVHN